MLAIAIKALERFSISKLLIKSKNCIQCFILRDSTRPLQQLNQIGEKLTFKTDYRSRKKAISIFPNGKFLLFDLFYTVLNKIIKELFTIFLVMRECC